MGEARIFNDIMWLKMKGNIEFLLGQRAPCYAMAWKRILGQVYLPLETGK